MHRWIKNIIALSFGIIASLVILECFLRIFHPFPFRVRGNQINLPANEKYVISNTSIPVLEKRIIHSKNKLGFRGDDFPSNVSEYYTIFCIGGSTTECYYLSDGTDWPNILGTRLKKVYRNVWLNNAGLDGHSTFGHKILLQHHIVKLKPNMVIFLVGINDIGREDLGKYDVPNAPSDLNWKGKILENLEIVFLIQNLHRVKKAYDQVLGGHEYVDVKLLDSLHLPETYIDSVVMYHFGKYAPSYKVRIKELISICLVNGITPVFCTQPILWGGGVKTASGISLDYAKTGNYSNGELIWKICRVYNNVLRETCAEQNIILIDLEKKMSKDPGYYYDGRHFTLSGSEKVAEIIYDDLILHAEVFNPS